MMPLCKGCVCAAVSIFKNSTNAKVTNNMYIHQSTILQAYFKDKFVINYSNKVKLYIMYVPLLKNNILELLEED